MIDNSSGSKIQQFSLALMCFGCFNLLNLFEKKYFLTDVILLEISEIANCYYYSNWCQTGSRNSVRNNTHKIFTVALGDHLFLDLFF